MLVVGSKADPERAEVCPIVSELIRKTFSRLEQLGAVPLFWLGLALLGLLPLVLELA